MIRLRPVLAWVALAVLPGMAAVAVWGLIRHPADFGLEQALDWQPTLAFTQPWRALTAATVHYSGLHLGANLMGTLLVALLGAVARVPGHAVWAWAVAWPLTQFGLLLKPELLHFGGLSGVLHAGVAVVAVHLVVTGPRPQRWIGAAILAGACFKVLGESPWGAPLRHGGGWDIAVAPLAHATGLVAGVGCAAIAALQSRIRRTSAVVE